MTVLAWDGKTLAADKLMCSGETAMLTTKIERWEKWLLGTAGNASVGREMLDWFKDGAEPKAFPTSNRKLDEGSTLLVVDVETRQASFYISTPHPIQLASQHCALGTGDAAALVAMACGKTAREAVLLASQFVVSCGGGIDAIDLED
jgi:hypothetical protein